MACIPAVTSVAFAPPSSLTLTVPRSTRTEDSAPPTVTSKAVPFTTAARCGVSTVRCLRARTSTSRTTAPLRCTTLVFTPRLFQVAIAAMVPGRIRIRSSPRVSSTRPCRRVSTQLAFGSSCPADSALQLRPSGA